MLRGRREPSADRLRDADELLRRYREDSEHQVEEHLLVSAHPDRAAAVLVLEHPEHALHAGADAVADGLRGDDDDELPHYGILDRIDGETYHLRINISPYTECYHHCRRLTKQEIEELC